MNIVVWEDRQTYGAPVFFGCDQPMLRVSILWLSSASTRIRASDVVWSKRFWDPQHIKAHSALRPVPSSHSFLYMPGRKHDRLGEGAIGEYLQSDLLAVGIQLIDTGHLKFGSDRCAAGEHTDQAQESSRAYQPSQTVVPALSRCSPGPGDRRPPSGQACPESPQISANCSANAGTSIVQTSQTISRSTSMYSCTTRCLIPTIAFQGISAHFCRVSSDTRLAASPTV